MDCMFSGESPNNKEHVIPRWLQKRFSLANKTLYIPNGSKLKYSLACVPVKDEHNSEFGKIENNISQGIFDLNEIYLWAFKIHIGMLYRDSSLKADIKIPESPMILNIGDFGSEVSFFRMLYNIWRNGGETTPSPLGSVYIFDNLSPNKEFDFIHCFETGTVCLNIGDKFITVFLWDQADSYHSNIEETWNKHHVKIINSKTDEKEKSEYSYFAQHVWACESSYWLYRNRRSVNFMKTGNSLSLIPPTTRAPAREADENEYRSICRSFGLDLVDFNGETGNGYKQFDIESYLAKNKKT